MDIINEIKNSQLIKTEWIKMLGEELIEDIINNSALWNDIINDDAENNNKIIDFKDEIFSKNIGFNFEHVKKTNDSNIFTSFYEIITEYVFEQLSWLKIELMGKVLIEKLSVQFAERLSWLCIRCLISEMNELQNKELLQGKDSKEKYLDFINRYLPNSVYINSLFEKYPVMSGLIAGKTKMFTAFIDEIMKHLWEDRNDIITHLCDGISFDEVTNIQIGLSDEHISGKTVIKLTLDNGFIIYYKPHTLVNMINYNNIHSWLLKKCKMDNFDYHILSRDNYGWEAEIVFRPCKNKKEIEEYYFRIGVQVFLAYLLGVTDIHFENVIAHGKFPVIIDMEISPDRHTDQNHFVNHIEDFLKDTVMNSGLLPGNGWLNANINVSGLGTDSEQRAPYKMPVIKNKGTTEMSIAYEYPVIKGDNGLPILNGEKISFEKYVDQILSGFIKSYQILLNKKQEFLHNFNICFRQRSRYLFRNTQEYFMYINSSNFPEFMKRKDCRYLMLMHMNKGLRCHDRFRKQILKYEIECIYQCLIPIFYADGKKLYMGNGSFIDSYFEADGSDQIYKRLQKLSLKDLELQKRIMETSFWPYIKKGKNILKNVKPKDIADVLIKDMQEVKDDFGWMCLDYHASGNISLMPADMYLYNGICGIAIFFAALSKQYCEEQYCHLAVRLTEKMFNYTDRIIQQDNLISFDKLGLFSGETSFIYSYLVLYKISNKEIYLKYACKHAKVIINRIDYITEDDLISGKAGVILALLMLYVYTREDDLLEAAEHLATKLEQNAIPYQTGIGWICQGQKYALAGMAHGNSGIAMALTYLWKFTKEQRYLTLIQEAIRYEDSLYDEYYHNWLDIRDQESRLLKKDTIAWCHGAPGILTARIHILRNIDKQIEINKFNSIHEKLKQLEKENMCLCHGLMGIDEMVQFWNDCSKGISEINKISYQYKNDICLSQEDLCNPGFMIGLAGIGYRLLKMKDTELPSLICFDGIFFR